jgi:hypothetical protein
MFVEIVHLILEHTQVLDFVDYMRLRQVNVTTRMYMQGMKFREFNLMELDFRLYKEILNTYREFSTFSTFEEKKRYFLTHEIHSIEITERFLQLFGFASEIHWKFTRMFRDHPKQLIALIKYGLFDHVGNAIECITDTALYCNDSGAYELMEFLLSNNYYNPRTAYGGWMRSELELTTYYRNIDIIELLLRYGARLEVGRHIMFLYIDRSDIIQKILDIRGDEITDQVIDNFLGNVADEPHSHETRQLLIRFRQQRISKFVEIVHLVLEHTQILDFVDYIHLRQVNTVMHAYMRDVKFREFSLTELDFRLYNITKLSKMNFLMKPREINLMKRFIELYGIILPHVYGIEFRLATNYCKHSEKLILLIGNGLFDHINRGSLCFHLVEQNTCVETIEYIITHRYTDINEDFTNGFGWLLTATVFKSYKIFELLLKSGAKLELATGENVLYDCLVDPQFIESIIRWRSDELSIELLEETLSYINTRINNQVFPHHISESVLESRVLIADTLEQKKTIGKSSL